MASLFKALEAVTSVYQNLFVAYRAVAQKPLRYFLQNLNKFSKEQSSFPNCFRGFAIVLYGTLYVHKQYFSFREAETESRLLFFTLISSRGGFFKPFPRPGKKSKDL